MKPIKNRNLTLNLVHPPMKYAIYALFSFNFKNNACKIQNFFYN